MQTPALSSSRYSASNTALAGVRVEPVEFTSVGERIVGDLYLPAGVDRSRPGPGLVVTGAWMTVKEQMPARYAREMADRGFVALAFDFRGWGQSGGTRRQYEDPEAKIADIEAAVTYLGSRPDVDDARLGGLGICASSGYLVHAATHSSDIQSLALVAPWLHDRELVQQIYGGADKVVEIETKGDEAQAEYAATGRQSLVPAASLTDPRAVMFKAPYYTERERGLIPEWRNEVDPAFWRGWLTFDAIDVASKLHQPFLMVESEAAALPAGAHKFYAGLQAPKRELWLDNVTQFDFYDRDEPVRASSDAAAEHFHSTLVA